ncbi:MAG: hypothetical protein ACLR1G_00940 [Alistipes indistinctus]
MIDLYIDGKRLDTDQQTDAAITLSIGSVEDPSQSLTAFSKSIEVPATARNKEIMQFADQLHGVEQFNNAKHPARLEAGGVVVMTGTAQITKVTVNNLLNASYEVNLIGAEYEWAKKAAEAKLNETDGLGSWVFSAATIKSLLESNGGVYLFPVYRGKYTQIISEDVTEERTYTIAADYLPFFNIRLLVTKIIAQYGYSIRSNFFEQNELFSRLIVAGQWEKYDRPDLDEKWGFLAGRLSAAIAVLGVGSQANTIDFGDLGAVVTTADPTEETENSDPQTDLYNHGGCLSFPSRSEPVFTAPEDIVIGLEYDLEYTTLVKIGDEVSPAYRGKLFYIDTVNGRKLPGTCFGVDGKDVSEDMPLGPYLCTYTVSGGISLLESDLYIRFRKKQDGTFDDFNVKLDKTLRGYYGGFKSNLQSSCKAEVWKFEQVEMDVPPFIKYTWVQTNRTVNIQVIDEQPTVKLKYIIEPRFLRKGEQMKIPTPTFSCSGSASVSEADSFPLSMGLSIRTRVKSFFYDRPSYGSELGANNMLSSEITQMDFISAVKQMFDLMFYTNADTKEVYIEPREAFYTSTPMDWRGRMDYSQEIEITDAGKDIGKTIVLGYQTDDVIDRHNKETGTELGIYKEDILKYHAENEEDLTNPHFVPITVVKDKLPGANHVEMIDFSPDEKTRTKTLIHGSRNWIRR